MVPAQCAPRIVGPGGLTIKALERRTSTTVRVVHTVDGVRSEVLIQGETLESVDAAKREVVVWTCPVPGSIRNLPDVSPLLML